MSRTLVAYFSASGVTRRISEELAGVLHAQLHEIVPETAYTAADLDWTNRQSRSTVEMQDPNCRPAIKDAKLDMSGYDTIFVGFPIWWGREPSVVDTFLEAYDFSGKKVVPFCTSGGSEMGETAQRIRELTGADVDAGKRMGGTVSVNDLQIWASGCTQ